LSIASSRPSPKSDSRAVMRRSASGATPLTVAAQYVSNPGQRKCSSSAILLTNEYLLTRPEPPIGGNRHEIRKLINTEGQNALAAELCDVKKVPRCCNSESKGFLTPASSV
jgi:hypothetical protein